MKPYQMAICAVAILLTITSVKATPKTKYVEPTTEVIVEERAHCETEYAEETTEESTFSIVECYPPYDCPLDYDTQEYLINLCEQENVPVSLVLALIETESNFEADAISATGDYGLMQINKINHARLSKKYGIEDYLDPLQNIYCGVNMLAELINKYDDISYALIAYNCGEGRAKSLKAEGVETTEYSEKIMEAQLKYE